MPETLVIRLPDSADGTAESLVVDGSGAPLGDIVSGALATLTELAGGRKVVGLAPASRVLRTRADIPLKAKAKIQQALPFALEEQLAGDVDDQHFAFAGRDDGGQIPVAVVARDSIDTWLHELSDAGLSADALYAESDALAAVPSTLTLLVDGDRIVIREADGSATVADPDSLQTIIELLLDAGNEDPVDDQSAADDGEPTVVEDTEENEPEVADDIVGDPVNILVYCRESDHERFAVLWDMLRLRVDSMDIRILPDGALPRLASQIVNGGGVNLLQGAYAPKRELPVEWRLWQLPAVLLGAFAAIMLISAGVDLWRLTAEEESLDTAASELLQTTFPQAGQAADPWGVLRSRLGATDSPVADGPGGPGFAEAADALAAAYDETPGLKIDAMSYREGNVDLQLVAPSVDRLEQLRKGIAEGGTFEAEILSANPDGDTIKGRVRITAAGGGAL